MKYCCFLFVFIVSNVMANSQQLDSVDLGKGLGLTFTKSWIGKDVSTVIDVDNISKLILLKAVTSAPTNLDVSNIADSIKRATKFESRPPDLSKFIIWQALLIMKNGEYIHYQYDGKWIHIATENGGGFFRQNDELRYH